MGHAPPGYPIPRMSDPDYVNKHMLLTSAGSDNYHLRLPNSADKPGGSDTARSRNTWRNDGSATGLRRLRYSSVARINSDTEGK